MLRRSEDERAAETLLKEFVNCAKHVAQVAQFVKQRAIRCAGR